MKENLENTTELKLEIKEEIPWYNATHSCSNCRFNDGMVYTSNPPKYKCTFDNKFYEGYHICHLDLVPVTRCEKCKWFIPVDKIIENAEFKNKYPWKYAISAGYDGMCTSVEVWRHKEDYCSEGNK